MFIKYHLVLKTNTSLENKTTIARSKHIIYWYWGVEVLYVTGIVLPDYTVLWEVKNACTY